MYAYSTPEQMTDMILIQVTDFAVGCYVGPCHPQVSLPSQAENAVHSKSIHKLITAIRMRGKLRRDQW